MSTLRISNIEAKADASSPTVNEKLKFTSSPSAGQDPLLHLDGLHAASGITTIGINTTGNTITVKGNDVNFAGIVTALRFSGPFTDLTINDDLTVSDGLTVSGIATFNNDVEFVGPTAGITSAYWDKSANKLIFKDNSKLVLGTGEDFTMYHDGSGNTILQDDNNFYIKGNSVYIQANQGEPSAYFTYNGPVKLFYDGGTHTTPKLQTSGIGVTVTGTIDLDTISKSISKTAVDLFVYDTRKDSDGGAWRKRTSHTSWYNETLGTSTRGSRKEFPAVALIVAETGTLTIYDGDDPELPMWMVFEVNTASADIFINDSSSTISSIAALNGRIFVGSTRTSTTGNLTGIDFIGDRGGMVYTSSADIRTYSAGIGQRNDGSGNWLAGTSNWFTKGPIVNRNVNDVAMTVLPNAPTDDVTGILIPTIVLTTAGGVTVIKDDGYAYDIQQSLNWKHVNIGEVKGRKVANYTFSTGGTVRHTYLDNIGLDAGNNTSYEDYPFSVPSYESTNGPRGGDVYGNDKKGLAIYDRWDDPGSNNNADYDDLLAYITSKSNSGWMYGDIKGAWLADTTTGTMNKSSATELVTNGTAWTGASGTTAPNGWTSFGHAQSVFTVDSGPRLKIGNGAANNATAMHQNITTVVGTTYTLYFDYEVHSSAQYAIIRVGTATLNGSLGYLYGTSTSSTSSSLTFVATTTSTNVSVQIQAASGNAHIWVDNISLKAIGSADRSIRAHAGAGGANGLAVYGTITKTAVATGAELVAYSGNGTSNYLEQPYNADLAFGTNEEFTAMGWLYTTNVGGGQVIFDRSVTYNSSRDFQSWIAADLRYMTLYIGGSQTVNTGNNAFENNQWFHFCCFRRKNNAYIYINGEEKGHGVGSTNTSVASGNRSMKILYDMNSNTKMALFRFSKGAPTDEHIKKIYEDEKRLFAPNAKCTLHGSSDEILALAYDDSTDIIHAGTSAGRSEFVGLNRINNTTTAVATAISASNGFVADE